MLLIVSAEIELMVGAVLELVKMMRLRDGLGSWQTNPIAKF